jgi:TetR/AcrR family transcriptional regulator, tetracycline repressor protein
VETHRRHGRAEVVAKAAHLLDEYGLADLTMRRLARELGLTPGALYWHFADKQELLGAVADRILEPTCREPADAPWAARIVAIGSGLREALLSSTDGAELVSATFASGTSQALRGILERLVRAAGDAGFVPTNAELAARTIVYYVLGFTADEQSRLQWDAAGALPAEQSVLTSNPNARFTFGLRLLTDGMAARQASDADDGVDPGVAIPAP